MKVFQNFSSVTGRVGDPRCVLGGLGANIPREAPVPWWWDKGSPTLGGTVLISLPFPSQVKVMHKQLLLFHNAISAYFAGNQQQLEQTLKQFNIKLKSPGADKPSWLEEQ